MRTPETTFILAQDKTKKERVASELLPSYQTCCNQQARCTWIDSAVAHQRQRSSEKEEEEPEKAGKRLLKG